MSLGMLKMTYKEVVKRAKEARKNPYRYGKVEYGPCETWQKGRTEDTLSVTVYPPLPTHSPTRSIRTSLNHLNGSSSPTSPRDIKREKTPPQPQQKKWVLPSSSGVRTTHSLFIYMVLPFNKEFSTLHVCVITCIILVFYLYHFSPSFSLHLAWSLLGPLE